MLMLCSVLQKALLCWIWFSHRNVKGQENENLSHFRPHFNLSNLHFEFHFAVCLTLATSRLCCFIYPIFSRLSTGRHSKFADCFFCVQFLISRRRDRQQFSTQETARQHRQLMGIFFITLAELLMEEIHDPRCCQDEWKAVHLWCDRHLWWFRMKIPFMKKKKLWKLSNFMFAVKSTQNIKHWASRHDELSLGEGRHAKRYGRLQKSCERRNTRRNRRSQRQFIKLPLPFHSLTAHFPHPKIISDLIYRLKINCWSE